MIFLVERVKFGDVLVDESRAPKRCVIRHSHGSTMTGCDLPCWRRRGQFAAAVLFTVVAGRLGM